MLQYWHGSVPIVQIKLNGMEYKTPIKRVCTYAGMEAAMNNSDLCCSSGPNTQWYTIKVEPTMLDRVMTPKAHLSFITEQEACDILKPYIYYLKKCRPISEEQELYDILKAHAPHLIPNFDWSDNINK